MSARPLVKNAADEEQVSRAAERQKTAREGELEDLAAMLANPQGRRVMWRLLEACGIFRSSFSAEAGLTAFNEGARNIGLMLLADINEACPQMYVTMLNEARAREERNG